MSRLSRRWKLILPLGVLAIAASMAVSTSFAASGASSGEIRVAIMTDCKGAFGFGYEIDIGGAQAALAQYAGGKVKNPKKPSAGMTGIKAGGKDVRIVGYGCGDDTVPTAVKETRRLMEQLRADVMIGPLSGDEAVYVARYAKSHPTKTFIIGTAGSQDPTLQLAQPNVFRYHGDGAQWNAGTGEIAYKRLGWRNAAIIMDDYSFGWTSAAGLIADFCAIGGKITKRVYPPLNTTDYSSYVQQLPGARHGGRVLLGRRRDRHGGEPEGVRADLRGSQAESAHREPVLRVPRCGQGRRSEGRRLVRRRLRHRPRPQDEAGEGLRGRRREALPGPERRELRRRVRLQLLQRRVGARPGPDQVRRSARQGAPARRCRARSSRATRSPTAVSSGSTGTGRRSRISTRCRSSRAGTRSGRPSSATCRTSTSPSAASSRRRARRLAARSRRA